MIHCYGMICQNYIIKKYMIIYSVITVSHPDVFWYRLNGMGAQKNVPTQKSSLTLFPYICFT